MRDYQIAKQNVESFYAAQQGWDAEEDLKNETTAAEISIRAIINMQIGDCPLFLISGGTGMNQRSQSEGVA